MCLCGKDGVKLDFTLLHPNPIMGWGVVREYFFGYSSVGVKEGDYSSTASGPPSFTREGDYSSVNS